jgi:YfiH family protein
VVVLTENPGARSQKSGDNLRTEGGGPSETFDVVIRGMPEEPFRFAEGDALITDIPGVSIGIRTADCLALLLADTSSGAVCAVHCGWRSLAAGLAGKAINVFLLISRSSTQKLRAVLGPSIGVCHYEIGKDVRQAFIDSGQEHAGLFEERDGSLYLDLKAAVKVQLMAAGMKIGDIEEIPGCTICNRDLFWSYRAGDKEERMTSFITARKSVQV